ncbi:hypothetical protein [Flavobacterium rivuli]|nr:hypothetical protein [Flavobacterium rivuli]
MKIIILLSLITHFAFAQKSTSCSCPTNTMAGTIKGEKPKESFHFTTGEEIILCGYTEEQSGKTTYSEFILQECGKNEAINFWGAIFTGSVDFKNDVISIKEIRNLPTGPERSFISTFWSTETFRYDNNKLVRKHKINQDIRKYTKAEIEKTLKEFEAGKNNYAGDAEEVMYRLFIAALSGNSKAKKYFNEFSTFTMLDGAVSEDYKELTSMLQQWE